MKLIFILLIILTTVQTNAYAQSKQRPQRIIVIIEANDTSGKMPEITWSPAYFIALGFEPVVQSAAYSSKIAKIIINSPEPVIMNTSLLGRSWYMAEPGDSIHINASGTVAAYSGKGAEKIKLLKQFEAGIRKLKIPSNPKFSSISSEKDFFEWNAYLDQQEQLLESLLQANKNHLSGYAFQYIKSTTLAELEKERLFKFGLLVQKATAFNVTPQRLCHIFDSAVNNMAARWLHSLSAEADNVVYYYDFIRRKLHRQLGFEPQRIDSLNNTPGRKLSYYRLAKETYRGHILQNYIALLLTEQGIKEHGFVEPIEGMVKDYLQEKDYAQYKTYVRDYVQKKRLASLQPGTVAPDFSVTGMDGKTLTKKDFAGKITLLDFWFTGCPGCVETAQALRTVEQQLKNDTNVNFLSVSVDKSRSTWLASIAQGKYTTGTGIHAYTNGAGQSAGILEAYDVTGYPQLFLIDPYGRFLGMPRSDVRKDNGKELAGTIKKQLHLLSDGPYVICDQGTVKIKAINAGLLTTANAAAGAIPLLKVPTDEPGQSFYVKVKQGHTPEPSEFPEPDSLFVVSDIEGNFEALRKLLHSNKIIDRDFNWTFGKGQLVINGDVFDRGQQVTECLWLIYSLEEKAAAAGGYVHFILGNHEIMNLAGDHRYVHAKYKTVSAKMQLAQLYGPGTELGKWLRTKNIMEKIGGLLFVHGGISREINNMMGDIKTLNQLARNYYDSTAEMIRSIDKRAYPLFASKTSPFWYRRYYDEDAPERIPVSVVDSTLEKFGVSRIITGHTIIADTVSAHYDNRVINTDTPHAKGSSEGLYIKNEVFYRADISGRKQKLFVSRKPQPSASVNQR